MSEIVVNVGSSFENSTKPGLKSVARKVLDLLKPYLAGLSLLLGALSALYISGVTNGSTSRALDLAQSQIRVNQTVISSGMERLARVEVEQAQTVTLAPALILMAKEQGELKGAVNAIAANVNLLLEVQLRELRDARPQATGQGSTP